MHGRWAQRSASPLSCENPFLRPDRCRRLNELPIPAPLWRRFAAAIYDGLLLLALWMCGAFVDVLSRSDERFLMAGGSSSLIEAMAARLASRITTYRRAVRIDPSASGARVVFSNGDKIDASAVIVTTPASIMSRIAYGVPLPPLWRQFIAEVTAA